MARSRKEALEIAKQAGDGKPPVHHNAHGDPIKGYRPHYHPKGKSGHIFYSIASGMTASYWAERYGAFQGLAEAVDFFNPLSLPKDLLDARDILYEEN